MDDRELMKRWVETWKQAGPELEAIRLREIRDADNVEVAAGLSSAIDYAVRLPVRTSSGMVEMQRLFAKWKPVGQVPDLPMNRLSSLGSSGTCPTLPTDEQSS